MIQTLQDFYAAFYDDISVARKENTFLNKNDEYFTALMFDYLSEIGETFDPSIVSFRDNGVQLNGYALLGELKEENRKLQIFVDIFNDTPSLLSITRTDVSAAMNRGLALFRKAVNNLTEKFQRNTDEYSFAQLVFENRDEIKVVEIVLLTNGIAREMNFDSLSVNGALVSFQIWDLDRLFKCMTSGRLREPIDVDFVAKFGKSIPCVKESVSEKYQVFLSIIDGEILAKLYQEYSTRLLERNVRSFLQLKGKVNKSIRQTLLEEPEMFLAFNNGITVTAQDVIFTNEDQTNIQTIRDMQIVNGGQTTASLYQALVDKYNDIDLSKVKVQMKLSKIENLADMDEIVPKISAFSNSQNNVQIADFSSNDPFHRKMEAISRSTWSPSFNGSKPKNWFFERTRGQYSDALSREPTPVQKRNFKDSHPLVTKTDLAKVLTSWEQHPEITSLGSQKCFNFFMDKLKMQNTDEITITGKYYENSIAKVILFRSIEKIVQNQNFGGYRSNITAYTLSLISYFSGKKINLGRIWKEQKLSDALVEASTLISHVVQHFIVYESGGSNVGEFCKKSSCWESLKNNKYDLSKAFFDELLDSTEDENLSTASEVTEKQYSPEEKRMIDAVSFLPPNEWYGCARWAKENNQFDPIRRSLLFSMGTIISRKQKPTPKQAKLSYETYEEALRLGFSR